MCRNIRPLYNFEPPATEEEIRAASLQFVRKISGFTKPSRANEAAFTAAVDEIAAIARQLLDALETPAAPKHRLEEEAKRRPAPRNAMARDPSMPQSRGPRPPHPRGGRAVPATADR